MCIHMYMHPCTQVCVYKRFVLAHALREAEKSQDLQFAEWRPGRADGTSSSPKANRHGTLERPLFHSELEGRVRPLSQLPVRQEQFLLISLLVVFRPSVGWMRPTLIREGHLPD